MTNVLDCDAPELIEIMHGLEDWWTHGSHSTSVVPSLVDELLFYVSKGEMGKEDESILDDFPEDLRLKIEQLRDNPPTPEIGAFAFAMLMELATNELSMSEGCGNDCSSCSCHNGVENEK